MTPVSAIEGHRLWAPGYDRDPNPLLALGARLLEPLLAPVAGLAVVDVACGTGLWTERLAGRGARVIGIDACDGMLARASAKPRLSGRLILADAAALPLPAQSSALTLCAFAIGYFARLDRALAEMARVTRRGGTVAVCDLHPAAAAAGWNRSFRRETTVYRMEHFMRTSDQICGEARLAGLALERRQDGSFGEPERAIFQAAGKEGHFLQAAAVPAVWIALWRRP